MSYRFAPLLALVLALAPTALAQNTVLDGVAAVVGPHLVLHSEVEGYAAQMAQQQGTAVTDALRRRALEDLVNQRVLLTHAERDTTIKVTDDQIQQSLDQRIAELARSLGGEAEVERTYGKSVTQLRADFREQVREQLLAQDLQRRKYFQIKVTPSEVRRWFEAIPADSLPEVPALVRVAHIVRMPEIEPAAREEARGMAAAVRDSILAGTPIEDLARRYSDDPGSRDNGGRYAGISVRDLVPEFGAVASTMEPGALSQVFETPFGYHVLRLNERRGDLLDFNHVLIRVDDTRTNDEPAREMLLTLRDSVVNHGVPFEAMAKRYSEDPLSANRGGYVSVPQTGERDLRLEALGPLWVATLDTMEVGEVSQPAEVRLLDGKRALHIVLLQRRAPAHRLSLKTDYALIEQYALSDKRAREIEEWVAGLREEVYIDYKGPYAAVMTGANR